MGFEAKVKCDANGCCREIHLSDNPFVTEQEYYDLEKKGWLINVEDCDYCPKCAPIVKAELEQEE
ncbi:hypothetical protein PQI64_12715 [Shewanella bicestrii]